MVRTSAASALNWIAAFQFLQNVRRQPGVNNILRICRNHLWGILSSAFPFPSSKAKYVFIKFVREALGPGRQFLTQVGIKKGLQRNPVSNLLISGGLIN